ncbi:hypothetical protein [Streptacidiphilus sp. MAP5-52]|uniref:hypothetical protein n=1 Tax=Streptacidiphilus sp. MAP5-52 TaxID=3156267 RepID=UPI0035144F9A
MEAEKLLAILAGDLAGHKTRLEALESLKLSDLREQVGRMTDLLIELTAQKEEEVPEEEEWDPTAVPDWRTMNREDAREAWTTLVAWCRDVLYPTYCNPTIWRPCWYQHARIREELTWLCAHWHWSYKVKGAPPTRAAEWHARWWPYVRPLLKDGFTGCYELVMDEAKLKASLDTLAADPANHLTADQQAKLDELKTMRAESERMAAAAARKSPTVAGKAQAARPKPSRHYIAPGTQRWFTDDEAMSAFIEADLAARPTAAEVEALSKSE